MNGSWMNYSGKGWPTMRSQIAAKSMRGIELVPVLDVRCFLAHQKYVTAFHGKGETIITDSLRDLEAEFVDAFLRVHRNALVSVGFIEGFERSAPSRYQIRLAGVEQRIPVSRRHAPMVRRRIEALAGSRRRGQGHGSHGRRGPQATHG
ncbi:MAG: LytTR family transcriptional regulator [Gammaproteobacteria bacterium]|nr:LytTR family transcriptional regulator [Gammaproteobacteria bacterium]MYF10519.1 LytTR family transcriptional regulator [Gammaproteobacteria bacterium]